MHDQAVAVTRPFVTQVLDDVVMGGASSSTIGYDDQQRALVFSGEWGHTYVGYALMQHASTAVPLSCTLQLRSLLRMCPSFA